MSIIKENEMTRLFGHDGIRGRANEYPITPEVALSVGKAIAALFTSISGKKRPRAIIGKDTRLSGYMLETALTSGLVSAGMDVFEIGPLPTPAVAHLTKSMCADCGIMITASHNPASDNGIKIFTSSGYKLPEELETKIEDLVFTQQKNLFSPSPNNIGKAFRIDDARGRYIEFAKSSIHNHSLSGIKAVLDCANGASYYIAPLIFNELGMEVCRTATSPDGSNINDQCGAIHPQNIARLVKEHKADIGISFDGDADRVVFCDAAGNIISGDRIIALCALDYKRRNRLAGNTLALTCMSNMGLVESLAKEGINCEVTPVGDFFVIDRMREKGLNFGGENTGHYVFHDYTTTGDGIISALHVANIMKERNMSLQDLTRDIFEEYPQIITSLPVRQKVPMDQLPKVTSAIADAENALKGVGRILVRYACSERKCRILVEAKKMEDAEKYSKNLTAILSKELV